MIEKQHIVHSHWITHVGYGVVREWNVIVHFLRYEKQESPSHSITLAPDTSSLIIIILLIFFNTDDSWCIVSYNIWLCDLSTKKKYSWERSNRRMLGKITHYDTDFSLNPSVGTLLMEILWNMRRALSHFYKKNSEWYYFLSENRKNNNNIYQISYYNFFFKNRSTSKDIYDDNKIYTGREAYI